MKLHWDYSDLAKHYLKRPDYSRDVIYKTLETMELDEQIPIVDIGAGVAHLTLILADKFSSVTAIEPNLEMMKLGQIRTNKLNNIMWLSGSGENTGLPGEFCQLVTFGSSFNVCNREMALQEASRVLTNNGWFCCMWNHRDLNDPIQAQIETFIHDYIPDYSYGTRREDQTEIIDRSGLFHDVHINTGVVVHKTSAVDQVEAWRSHATLKRQAGNRWDHLIAQIEEFLINHAPSVIEIPYETKIWFAKKKFIK